MANIYAVFAYMLGRCPKCFLYEDSFNLDHILKLVLLSIPVLEIREQRYGGISKTCSRLHCCEETEAGLKLEQLASSCHCFHDWTIVWWKPLALNSCQRNWRNSSVTKPQNKKALESSYMWLYTWPDPQVWGLLLCSRVLSLDSVSHVTHACTFGGYVQIVFMSPCVLFWY